MRSGTWKLTSSRKQIGAYIMTSERYTIHALEYDKDSWDTLHVLCAVMRGLSSFSTCAGASLLLAI